MKYPVFLLASERSGTNLLRRRLTEYQEDYFGPAPLHFLKHLYWAEPYYGDFSTDTNFESFIQAALGLAYHHFSPWDEEITVKQVRDEYSSLAGNDRSSIGVMHVMYSLYARRKGYSTYFCKDNNLFDFVPDIQAAFPNAKFIYLYRDPRDVILSQLKRPLQNRSIAHLANLWREEQLKCIRHSNALSKHSCLATISYEELIANESLEMSKLCQFIEVGGNVRADKVFGEEKTDIQEWENLNKPTMSDNSGKFMKGLSASAIRKIEGICWHQMRWLGYEPISDERPELSKVRSALEVTAGKMGNIVRAKIQKKGITTAQIDRVRYTRALKSKWR